MAARKGPKANGAAIISRRRKQLPPAATATMIEVLEMEDQNSPKADARKKLRTFDAKVAKNVRDNFPNWPSQLVDVLQKDGLTLRQRIARDKGSADEPDVTTVNMGKHYYQKLRDLYSESGGPDEQLVVKDKSEEEDPVLRKAILCFVKKSNVVQPLTEWFESTSQVNQKNVCALFRQLLKTYPAQNMVLAILMCDTMKLVTRLDLKSKFPHEVMLMFSHFDLALQKTLINFKANGMSTNLWWQQSKDFASLILPAADVDAVMACVGSWDAVEHHMVAVVESSGVGKILFQKAMRAQRSQKLEQQILGIVTTLRDKSLTQQAVNAIRHRFIEHLRESGCDELAVARKTTNVYYRGIRVIVEITSCMDMFNLHVEAFIRSEVVLHKHLPTLWCEDELTNQKVKACPDMEASLVKHANVSRLAALGFVSDETGPSLRATLQSKQGFLLQCDCFFKLELAFWYQSIGDEAADRLHNAIIECFPDGKKILSSWNVKQS